MAETHCIFLSTEHFCRITVTSQWAKWRLKTPTPGVFAQSFFSGAHKKNHQSPVSLAFVRGIHRWPVDSPHKGPVTRKMFSFDALIMEAAHKPAMMFRCIVIIPAPSSSGEGNVVERVIDSDMVLLMGSFLRKLRPPWCVFSKNRAFMYNIWGGIYQRLIWSTHGMLIYSSSMDIVLLKVQFGDLTFIREMISRSLQTLYNYLVSLPCIFRLKKHTQQKQQQQQQQQNVWVLKCDNKHFTQMDSRIYFDIATTSSRYVVDTAT